MSSVLIHVFVPETRTKTRLLHNDLQSIREWAKKNSVPDNENSVVIYRTNTTMTQCIFLEETLKVFGSWKNVRIH
jgi:hypothetical protein